MSGVEKAAAASHRRCAAQTAGKNISRAGKVIRPFFVL